MPDCTDELTRALRALHSGTCVGAQYTHALHEFFFVSNQPDARLRRKLKQLMVSGPAILHLSSYEQDLLLPHPGRPPHSALQAHRARDLRRILARRVTERYP